MKFTGLLISCAMPAVSWPRDAIFSAFTSWLWVRFRWSLLACSSRVRSCTFDSSIAFCSRMMRSFSWAMASASAWLRTFSRRRMLMRSARPKESRSTSATEPTGMV
ncbi:MAG: hypothetical protein GFGODING_03239 [Flavobacteriales bacterium]|nr:hypothetical protein [Flavobacteriales bacterium]